MPRTSHRLFKALSLSLALAFPIGLAVADSKGARDAKLVKDTRPNLTAAQKLVSQAFDELETAEKANEYDMEGHAQKAKDLLKTASDEIKLAAEAAKTNSNPHKTANK